LSPVLDNSRRRDTNGNRYGNSNNYSTSKTQKALGHVLPSTAVAFAIAIAIAIVIATRCHRCWELGYSLSNLNVQDIQN